MVRPEQPEYVDVTTYIVIEPKWSHLLDGRRRPILDGGRVTRAAQSPPGAIKNGGIATRVTFRVDAAALLPLQPQAIIHIHADDIAVIEAVADAPEEPEQ